MGEERNALVLANSAAIARNGSLVRWGKYEVLVGERKQFRDLDVWYVAFPERGKDGVSILIADSPFHVSGGFARFSVAEGKAFVTTDDIKDISIGGDPLALKISLARASVRLPPIPLHHVVGMERSESKGILRRIADLTDFGIPLRITNYELPFSAYECFVHHVADHFDKPATSTIREETIDLETSGYPRVLFAYGQKLFLCEQDLSTGLMAVIPPETEMVLRISRRPGLDNGRFYSSGGVVIVLEDLDTDKPASGSHLP